MNLENIHITVVGLGYVGLPLAVEFGKKYVTKGFDVDKKRIEEVRKGYDRTKEMTPDELMRAEFLSYESDNDNIGYWGTDDTRLFRNIFIITVPTPIDQYKKPDLTQLLSASRLVGEKITKGDVIIYESTVYPGCTEEDCVPVLEASSGLKYNSDFYCGYSPERINPGDKQNPLTKILKVTSGSTPEITDFIDNLYKSIIEAGTFKASSIKVAEAAKIIENCQRDVNISFVNELALIFDRMDIDTNEVLEAAGTKWNFLKFKPGLVGGHCIGVDPYYMIHKAESLGYRPEVIGAGRRINDNMGTFVATKVIKLMIQKGIQIKGARALIFGFTFKENCADTRNTRVIDIYNELNDYGLEVEVTDPWANIEDVNNNYGISLTDNPNGKYDAIVLAVSHREFLTIDFGQFKSDVSIMFDVKSAVKGNDVVYRL